MMICQEVLAHITTNHSPTPHPAITHKHTLWQSQFMLPAPPPTPQTLTVHKYPKIPDETLREKKINKNRTSSLLAVFLSVLVSGFCKQGSPGDSQLM